MHFTYKNLLFNDKYYAFLYNFLKKTQLYKLWILFAFFFPFLKDYNLYLFGYLALSLYTIHAICLFVMNPPDLQPVHTWKSCFQVIERGIIFCFISLFILVAIKLTSITPRLDVSYTLISPPQHFLNTPITERTLRYLESKRVLSDEWKALDLSFGKNALSDSSSVSSFAKALLAGKTYKNKPTLNEEKLFRHIYWLDLSGKNLSASRLASSLLIKANLGYVNFRYADLHNADLSLSNVGYANFDQADLSGANLEGIVFESHLLGEQPEESYVGMLCRANSLYKATMDAVLRQKIQQKCPARLKKFVPPVIRI
jgi:hypothetical protein